MAEDRLNVFPSQMELTAMKERDKAAVLGYNLLKRKSDALKLRLNSILKEILSVKREVAPKMRDAAFTHTEAVYAAGEFNNKVIQSVSKATYRVEADVLNVAGVKVPEFKRRLVEDVNTETLLGLSQGGSDVSKCRDTFEDTLDGLIKLASLQTQLKTIDEQLKVTNRRVNCLEFVIQPKIQATIKYIKQELEEQEREDKNRIAKVKSIIQLQENAERMAREEALMEEAPSVLQEEDPGITDAFD